jgi:hypothetical protein
MKKKLFTVMAALLLAIVLPLTSAYALSTFAAETETRIYKPDKSYNGYFMNGGGSTVYLLDLWGNVYNIWNNVSGTTSQLYEDGTLWSNGQIQNWEGNELWKFTLAADRPERTDLTSIHHDFRRVWNKKLNQYTMLMVVYHTATQAECLAAGGDPSINYTAGSGTARRNVSIDSMIEVNMNKEIVWEWRFIDHTVQSKNPAWPNYKSDVKDAPGKLDVFWRTDAAQPAGTEGIVYDWLHVNSLDYNEDLGHIAINARQWSTFFVVDHDKTFVSATDWAANKAAAKGTDGDFIYRWGNPSAYNQGKAPSYYSEGEQQMYGSHNIQWIKPYHWSTPKRAADTWPDPRTYVKSGIANPGAGNFLIFDNGLWNPLNRQSRTREINPRIGASGTEEVAAGKYINPPDAGYTVTNISQQIGKTGELRTSKQIVWNYASQWSQSFYSSHISGMERLPNGNTSINSGNQGLMFEVTPSGEVVWEYIWPGGAGTSSKTIATDGTLTNIKDTSSTSGTTSMFRHHRIGADHPALIGRNMTSKGTLTGRLPRLVGSSDTYPTPVTYTGFGFGATGTSVGGGGVGSGSAGGPGGY